MWGTKWLTCLIQMKGLLLMVTWEMSAITNEYQLEFFLNI